MGIITKIFSKKESLSLKKYSSEWFKTVTYEILSEEREPVRIDYCQDVPGAEGLLKRFDDEMVKRMNEKYEREHPNAQARRREHGWYLPNDE